MEARYSLPWILGDSPKMDDIFLAALHQSARSAVGGVAGFVAVTTRRTKVVQQLLKISETCPYHTE